MVAAVAALVTAVAGLVKVLTDAAQSLVAFAP